MISVIVSIYKQLNGLDLILQALNKQTYKGFEVIVSEDDNSERTVDFINKMRNQYDFIIKHVSQEDLGFRKTRILNKAVISASYEKLVFLDGDCIPHKRLLENYSKEIKYNTVCIGRRSHLEKKITDRIYKSGKWKGIGFLSLLFNSKRLEHGLYLPFLKPKENSKRKIIGCNWGILKQELIEINGYDEDYNGWGCGEDYDIDWRLREKKLNFINIKHKVIVYHLYHKVGYQSEIAREMGVLMTGKRKAGNIICKKGINNYNKQTEHVENKNLNISFYI